MWEGPLPIIPPGGFFRMKRGKKYQEAVQSFDKAAQYDVAEANSTHHIPMLSVSISTP